MSITALSGLAMVTGGVFSIRKTKPNRSTLCWRRIMESNHHHFRNGTVFKTAWAPCPLSSVRCDARCLSSGCFNELQFITTVRAFRESDPSRTAKERAFLAVVQIPLPLWRWWVDSNHRPVD